MLAVIPALLLLMARPALAHAGFVGSSPAQGQVVQVAPKAVTVRFTEVVDPVQSQIVILGPDGQQVARVGVSRDPKDATRLIATLPTGLRNGTYTVRWRVLSVDGHPVASGFRFAIGAPSAALTRPSGTGDSPSLLGGIGRALSDVGLLSLLGLAGFAPLALRPAMRRLGGEHRASTEVDVGRRLRPWLVGSAICALLGSLGLLVDTAAQTRGFRPGSAFSHLHDISALLSGTRVGHLLGLRVGGLLAILVIVGFGVRNQRRGKADSRVVETLLLVGSALLLLPVAMSSHAAAGADRPLAVFIDWTHLLAAGIWTGGLVALALGGLGAARDLLGRDQSAAADTAAALTRAFATGAQVCVVVVAATGLYAMLVHVDAVAELGNSSWGIELVVKLALLATVLLLAAANSVSIVPRMSRRAASTSARLAACGDLVSAVRIELLLAIVLVSVAAVLAGTAPPIQVV